MSDQGNGFLLKILSGLQFGVEVALSEGTYSFGSGSDADIQFADVSMQPIHGRIRIRGGKLDLKSDGGEITTSSGLAIAAGAGDWFEIAQLDIIEAGTTRFAVGGRGAKWASVASVRSAGALPAMPGATPTRRSNGFALGVLGVAAVALLSAGGFYFAGRDLRMAGLAQTETRAPVDLAREAIAALPFAHRVTIVETVDGIISAEGYVQRTDERRAVNNALLATGVPVSRRVWILDAIENEVRQLIASQGVDIDFTLSQSGVLTLTGTLLDPVRAAQVVSLVRDDVFGLSQVVDEVRTAPYYLAQANTLLDETRLRDRVILRLDGLLIEASGIVTTDRIDNWVGFVQVYASRYASILPLRSFVALETAGGVVGDPIVIGASAEQIDGRRIAPETLEPGSTTGVLDLFAQPLGNTEGETPLPSGPDLSPDSDRAAVIAAAIRRLVAERPELAGELMSQLGANEAPSFARLQEAATFLDAQLVLRNGDAGLQPAVQLPGLDDPVSLDEVRAVIVALAPGNQPAGIDADTATAGLSPGAAAPLSFSGLSLPSAASTRGATAGDIIAALTAPQAALVAQRSAPDGDDRSAPGDDDRDVEALQDPQSPSPVTQPLGAEAIPPAAPNTRDAIIAAEFERFPTRAMAAGPMMRLITSAGPLTGLEAERDLAGLGPLVLPPVGGGQTVLQLAQIQNVALANGETLLELPRPLSAHPVLLDRPETCWPESRVRVDSLPSVLLWLDLFSLHVDLDLATFDPELRPALMEAALSPDRIDRCLESMDTAFARRLAESSAFLAESRRNEAFAGYLFRNVPVFEIALVGVNMTRDRFLQTLDGTKLREGGAPDVASRLSAIGDRGALFRIEGGWRVALYPDSLSWRIVDDGRLP